MKKRYDLLVIGGGPAGAIAARTAAKKGLSVCLVEKRPAIGAPVRCAEGIGQAVLAEFIEPD
ncbi:MAG: FAD-dependent oxidoreductase, partial [Methanoregulaceae archaeon]|nr:FAD-dependent oxidoreductase [Methanoregulaceae archaeon]